jgi:D-glycero-beta-D-manno-heptose 1-phosphate adenylyltransferase
MGQVVSWDALLAKKDLLRHQGKIIVWTNGCFDLFHVGHLRSLQQASKLGDILVVGVNSDDSVRGLKGPGRPLVPENDRAELLAGLTCVNYAVIFSELTPEIALTRLRPDIHCKGADYGPGGKAVPEATIVEAYGGRVCFLPLVPGVSTSDLIRRVRQLGVAADASP